MTVNLCSGVRDVPLHPNQAIGYSKRSMTHYAPHLRITAHCLTIDRRSSKSSKWEELTIYQQLKPWSTCCFGLIGMAMGMRAGNNRDAS